MICTSEQLLTMAQTEIGYCEKKSNYNLTSKTGNAGSKNYTKYAQDLYKAGYWNGNKNGYDWCTSFVAWCIYKACASNLADAKKVQPYGTYGASCKWQTKYYKNANRWSVTPHVGDQAFFTRGHTGIVEKVSDTTVTLIEGNSNNKVERRTYKYPNSIFSGFGMPRYEKIPQPAPTVFEPYYGIVTPTNGLNVRTGAGTSFKKLGAIKYNTRVYILEVKAGWGRINYNNKTGWICLQYVKKV